MRVVFLALALLVIGFRADAGEVPHYELFLIKPDQIVTTTVTPHGDTETLEVTVNPPTAKAFLAFSQRNLGKVACIALLPPNKFLYDNAINLSPALVKAVVSNGVIQIRQFSRKAQTRSLLAD